MKIIALMFASVAASTFAMGLPAPEDTLKGIAPSDWAGIRAAYEAGRHVISRQEDGTLTARNPRQQWRTEFEGKGFTVTPDHGQWTWGLELTGYGEWTSLSAFFSSLTHEGGKITCQRDDDLTEWFINDIRGLEQGWTVQNKQRGTGVSPVSSNLTLSLAVRGELRAQLSADGSSVAFQTVSGTTALTYGGLKAWDADGKNLLVRFEIDDPNHFRIAIDDKNARYPITIDPVAQQAFLKASNSQQSDTFGYSVAVAGNTVVVGALGEDSNASGVNGDPASNGRSASGAAYVFVKEQGTWTQQAYLKSSNPDTNDNFGYAVAIAGDTIVVGVPNEQSSSTGVNGNQMDNSLLRAGAAYVFRRSGNSWSQEAYLKASNTEAEDKFGTSVAISENTIVVGAPEEDSNSTAINGDQLNNSGFTTGAAYIFERGGAIWSQQAYLKKSVLGAYAAFGESVAISSDTVVVGAFAEDSGKGAAYIFSRSGIGWIQQAILTEINGEQSDYLGDAVAISGDTAVVGATGEDSNSAGINGNESDNSQSDSGAAYIYVRTGSIWTRQAYIKASNPDWSDEFGSSVSISGNSVIVSSANEDSSALGLNGDESDNNAESSGAAYIFFRSAATWMQSGYMKSGNSGAADHYGQSVSISGDTAVVGAYGEDSGTTGINGVPNESAEGSGASYIFTGFSGAMITDDGFDPGISGSLWSAFGGTVAANTIGTAAGAGSTENSLWFGGAGVRSATTVPLNVVPGTTVSFLLAMADGSQLNWEDADIVPAEQVVLQYSVGAGPFVTIGGPYTNKIWTSYSVTLPPASYGNDTRIRWIQPENSGSSYDNWAIEGVVIGAPAPLPEIRVTDIANADLVDGISTVAFGAVSLGASGVVQSYTIENTGTGTLTGISITKNGAHPGDFAISSPIATSLLQGQSTSFTVTFTPCAADFRTCALHIASNDANENPFDIRLTGTGTSAAPLALAQSAYFKAGDTDINDIFGDSVAVSGNTVVVGIPGDDSSTTGVNSNPNESATYSGAAYVYVHDGTTWTQQAYLKAGNTGINDQFGVSVAISGDTIVAGADREDSSSTGVNTISNESATDAGAAYVFTRNGTTWSQQAYLKASNPDANDQFGHATAISGDTVIVGAYSEDSTADGVDGNQFDNSASAAGAAYVFVRNGTTWSQQAYLKGSTSRATDFFGSAVAISGETVVVGAYLENSSATGVNGDELDVGAADSGAAFVFKRSGSIWNQEAYLKASNTGENDRFGYSLSISGDTIAVSAPEEDSASLGVNGSQSSNGAVGSGATYVFVRTGVVWSQQAYLKASNTGANDDFGISVAISGDTIVVGAYGEDSTATGIDGDQSNEFASNAGAAYVFGRNGEVWTQRAYLKASNTGTEDRFGRAVAASGDMLVVGASLEQSNTTGIDNIPNNSADDAGAAYIFSAVPPVPEILFEWRGVELNGISIGFSPTVVGESNDETLTIRNTGAGILLLSGTPPVAVTGPDAGNFVIVDKPATPVAPNGSTTFMVRFAPINGGGKAATLSIPNNDPSENSFLISLNGIALSFSTDGDGDGMNDASEFKMASLGFNWQENDAAAVTTYYNNANGAGLYTPAQVQALHTGSPLIARDPISRKFKLTMDWKKSTNLTDFYDFPAPAGSTAVISPAGDIDFEFIAPGNAAFFRVKIE